MSATEWVLFDGTAEDNGSTYVLTAVGAKAQIVVDKMHVRLGEESVEVRTGAAVQVRNAPSGQRPADAPQALDDPCEGRGTMCVGLVEICCGNEKVIGPCEGVWGCQG
jgi:hypothetical protein